MVRVLGKVLLAASRCPMGPELCNLAEVVVVAWAGQKLLVGVEKVGPVEG